MVEKEKPQAATTSSSIVVQSNKYVFMVVAFGAVGGILSGMDQANFAGVETKPSFADDFCFHQHPEMFTNITHAQAVEACLGKDPPHFYTDFQAWGSSLVQLGAAVGALTLAPYTTRNLGRRAGLSIGCAVVIAGLLWCISNTNAISFYVARFFMGLGIGMITFTLPMWTSELAPKTIRGALGCCMQLACVLGTVIAFAINLPSEITWRVNLSATIYPAALVFLFIFLFPESPRFLLQKHGPEKARATLVKLRGTPDVDDEMAEIEESMDFGAQEEPWSTLWRDPSVRRRVLIANVLQWLQQLTGVNALLAHGPKLFRAAIGEKMDPQAIAFITTFFNLSGTIVMMFIVDRKGRRPLLLLSGAGMFIFMFASGVLAYSLTEAAGWGLFACVNLYFFSFAIAWGAVVWIIPSEIFSMDVKEKALSTSVFSQWIGNFCINQITPRQIDVWGPGATFFFYSFLIALGIVFVYTSVPETKGVSLDEMDEVFGHRRVRSSSCSSNGTPRTRPDILEAYHQQHKTP